MQINLHLIDVEAEDSRARGAVESLNVEQHDQTALRFGQCSDLLAQSRGELAVPRVPLRIAILGGRAHFGVSALKADANVKINQAALDKK